MKRIIIPIITLVFGLTSYAQSVERQVYATAGGYSDIGAYMVSYTIGEPIITSHNGATVFVKQGYQGSTDVSTSIKENDPFRNLKVKAYPIPTTGELFLEIDSETALNVSLRVFDYSGKEVLSNLNGIQVFGKHRELLDFSNLANGFYIIQLFHSNQELGRLKVLKQ